MAMLRQGRITWALPASGPIFLSLFLGTSLDPAHGQTDEPGGNVFEPSDLRKPVLSKEIPTPRFELNLTGRANDAFPRLDGEISFEIQNDYTFEAEDEEAELNDLFSTTELFAAFGLTPEVSLRSAVTFEPVKDPSPGEDQYFDDHGAFVETLGIAYETDRFSIFGGKFDPTFGVAWDIAPGIYGDEIPGDYELEERIGVGGSATFATDALGAHTLTAQTFFLDTTVLSDSLGTSRGRTREGDGGVSNTESFESFSVTLDGELPGLSEGLNYQLGLERQARGRTESEDEWGVAAALYGDFDLTSGFRLEPLIEWVRLEDREGEPNTTDYLTTGTTLFAGPWSLALSYSSRFTDPQDESAVTDHAIQVSGGYQFDFGVAVDLGYTYFEEDNSGRHVVGVLFVYDFEYAVY